MQDMKMTDRRLRHEHDINHSTLWNTRCQFNDQRNNIHKQTIKPSCPKTENIDI